MMGRLAEARFEHSAREATHLLFYSDHYDQQMTTFIENESKALELYDMVGIEPNRKVLNFITAKGIPAWETNIAITNELDSMQNMPADLHTRNGLLRNYCLMRIEVFELVYKAVKENTNMYDETIRIKSEEIEKIIKELS
jgi:rhomboid protease GluP